MVVTSRDVLGRAGLLTKQCLPDADVALDKLLLEVNALGPAVTRHRTC